jgi:hexosaminidase
MTVSQPSIIPRPRQIEQTLESFSLSPQTVIVADSPNQANAGYLQQRLSVASGYPFPLHQGNSSSEICLCLNDDLGSLGDHGYRLIVTSDAVKVEAGSPQGVFYGLQTLLQLLPPDIESRVPLSGIDWTIPGVRISDQPRFPWRGFMLDEGRHFHGAETVLALLDLMAALKMNIFHWHLTEDQGWRIQIKGYPCLTEIGSQRIGTAQSLGDMLRGRHDGMPHAGYYTQDQIRAIVAYAAERHIIVIPEIEIPGHSMAALAAYPKYSCTGGPFEVPTRFGIFKDIYCPGKEETFTFLQNILDEVMDLFPGPYIHIGGDEAPKARWKECADCQHRIREEGLQNEHQLQTYFTNRVVGYLAEHGRTAIGWNEALSESLHPDALIQYWVGNRKGVLKAVQGGRKTIISSYLDYYLDHSHSLTPLSRIYEFEPVFRELGDVEAENILGVEAPLWTEWVPDRARLDFQTFPRLLAFAETGWTPRDKKNIDDFRSRLAAFEPRLDALGVGYARGKDVQPSWFKRLFGLFTIVQPQRKTAN